MSGAPHIFSIRPGAPFLPTLADALLCSRLLPHIDLSPEAFGLSDLMIYVPTRRAARQLRYAIIERLGGRAAILPEIRPLGEFDEEAAFFESRTEQALQIAPPAGEIGRLLALAPLVLNWKRHLPVHVAARFGGSDGLVVPSSNADSIWLAREIAALIDAVETEGAEFARLASIVPQELDGWWQVTVEFLRIVTEFWPAHLAEAGLSDPATYRNAMIDAEAARLAANPAAGPVIAAGSTGSIPATARLLATIARHPQGAVVLPGLDLELDDAGWSMIGATAAPSTYGHPQYGLKKLLETIGAGREEVVELGAPDRGAAARCRLAAEALRPAETTDLWVDHRERIEGLVAEGALEGMTLVEAGNEQEEAAAIAVALRRAAEVPGRRAALVTGDRNLARRVSAELRRFGIHADDSGGRPLAGTPAARLLRLIALAAFQPGEPEILLDLLSHPLLLLGLRPSRARRLGALAELVLLRGGDGRIDLTSLVASAQRRRTLLDAGGHGPQWRRRIRAEDWEALLAFLAELSEAFGPLCEIRDLRDADLSECLVRLVRTLERLGMEHEGRLDRLYAGEDGEKLVAVLRELISGAAGFRCETREIPAILDALILPETVKPSAIGDSRIALWGVLEARLQDVDLVILGGMNEGSWPRKVEAGPFLSRFIGAEIGLAPPERRIGQAAHDFVAALGNREVVLTRAIRVDGAPSTPSRWLQRLLAILPENAGTALLERGRHLLELAVTLDRRERVAPARQPCPAPPLAARPRHFSVTEIETLRRDPYAIHARRILRLEPLEPISRGPDAADRGSLLHDILHRFVLAGINAHHPDAHAQLERIGRECFAEAALPPEVEALWWPRFERLIPEWLRWERAQSIERTGCHSEARAAATVVACGVTLSGRADRIDLHGERATILDFKTGSSPSKRQAHSLLAPQLALEGALLLRGAFTEIGPARPADLVHVRLRPDGKVVHESILKHDKSELTAEELAGRAWTQLQRLLAFHADARNGYLSRALPFREHDMDGDYDHLARVQEWLAGHEGGEGNE